MKRISSYNEWNISYYSHLALKAQISLRTAIILSRNSNDIIFGNKTNHFHILNSNDFVTYQFQSAADGNGLRAND